MKNKDFFANYINTFLNQNQVLNLISKNDEQYLWEKHIYDSLSIEKFFEKYNPDFSITMLDIGTGGGFPAVPIALSYPKIKVYALDSIRKKINAIENIKAELNIQNLFTICDRAENIKDKFDIITSRAVAPLKTIICYAMPLLKDDGYFIAYKSLKAQEEIEESKSVLKKYNAKITDIIQYDLPLPENHVRNLIVVSKN
ncbi:16S rRNA (guanine(527)-N(7))-methyltransferase RsmG [bacterium]|nr:16S rRNA (guanine(527)-N(7))-methyltransferase RsmG [bacterium]